MGQFSSVDVGHFITAANNEEKILQIKEKPTREMVKSKAQIVETLEGRLQIVHQGKSLKYEALDLVHKQGKVKDKKSLGGRRVA